MNALKALIEEMKLALYGPTPEGCCEKCKAPYSDANVFTAAGWRETRSSGLCEACWDALFKPMEDGEDA